MSDHALDVLNEEFAVLEAFPDLPPPSLSVVPPRPPGVNQWPPQLVFDLALALDSPESILLRHNLTRQELDHLYTNDAFKAELARLTHELRENNTIFKQKAKAQAETYLQEMDDLMADDDTPAGVKLSIFQTLVKLAELEPEKKAPVDPIAQGGVRMIVEWVGSTSSPPQPEKIIEMTHA